MSFNKYFFLALVLAVSANAAADSAPLTFSEHLRISRNIEKLKLELSEAELKDKLRKQNISADSSMEAPLKPVAPARAEGGAKAASMSPDGADAGGSYELESVFGIAGAYSAIFSKAGRKSVPMRVGDVLPGGLKILSIELRSATLRDKAGKEQLVVLSSSPEAQQPFPMIGGTQQPMPPYLGYTR